MVFRRAVLNTPQRQPRATAHRSESHGTRRRLSNSERRSLRNSPRFSRTSNTCTPNSKPANTTSSRLISTGPTGIRIGLRTRRKVGQANRALPHLDLSSCRGAWASKATFGNGRNFCGLVIRKAHLLERPTSLSVRTLKLSCGQFFSPPTHQWRERPERESPCAAPFEKPLRGLRFRVRQ